MSVSIAIIGAGQRGKDVYATFLREYYPEVKIVANRGSSDVTSSR